MFDAGWHNPIWSQLYPGTQPPSIQAPPPDHTPSMDYLDQLQQAAAAGATLNLSDLPGYQTNLQAPAAIIDGQG